VLQQDVQRVLQYADRHANRIHENKGVRLSSDTRACDVLVTGGGLAGLTFALQLVRRRPSLHIVLVDEGHRPAPERTSTIGESFAEVGAHYLRDVLSLHDHLDAHQLPKFGLRFFVGNAFDLADRFEIGPLSPAICEFTDGRFAGLPLRTHQVDRARLENELAVRCRAEGVSVCQGTRVESVALDGAGHRVTMTGEHDGQFAARWVVFAGGAHRPSPRRDRRPLGHRVQAAWLRVSEDLDVGTWSARTDFANRAPPGFRRFSTNHFMGRGYWIWVIALPSGVTSVGVVVDPDVLALTPSNPAELVDWIAARDKRLATELAAVTPVPGDFHVADIEASIATPCFSEDRWAVVGHAAAFVDVLYSPGADLIAIGNTLLVDLIERDLDTQRIVGASALCERVFGGFVEGLVDIYRGQYVHFDRPNHVATKVVWDSALYFGFHTLLFRHGLFGDPGFLAHLRPELRAIQSLQARVQSRMRRGDITPLFPEGTTTIDWGEIDWLIDTYLGAKAQPNAGAVRAQLSKVLATLEHVARHIEGAAG